MQNLLFRGNTYKFKAQLSKLGAKWDGASKAWVMPAADTQERRVLQLKLANDLHDSGVSIELETVVEQGRLMEAA